MGGLGRCTKLRLADAQTAEHDIRGFSAVQEEKDVEDFAPQRIVLRGFRRSH